MSDQPVTIQIVIHPPNKLNLRRVDVWAAPAGEMPVALSGHFADRHKLVDQAYGQVVRREPQALKGAAAKAQLPAEEPEETPEETPAEAPAETPAAADQIGPVATPAQETPAETLPAIAGDTEEPSGEGDDDE